MILDKPRSVVIALVLMVLPACAGNGQGGGSAPSTSGKPIVVVTTSTLASLVKTVANGYVEIQTLVPIGASPETYEPTPRDVVALEHASLVIENGSGLEAWLTKLIDNASSKAQILVLSDGLPTQVSRAGGSDFANPHFWLDPNYAAIYLRESTSALVSIEPAHAAQFHANLARELKSLTALDAWIRSRIATVPTADRAMITDHDAWYYFDKPYGIDDVGAIEQSPGKEPSAEYLAALIAKAKARHVRAVFAEPEFSPKLAKELASNAGITTITDLYDDSLGTSPELSSYDGMMRHDTNTIVRALRP